MQEDIKEGLFVFRLPSYAAQVEIRPHYFHCLIFGLFNLMGNSSLK